MPAGRNAVSGVLTDICYAGVSTEFLLRTSWGQELSVFTANSDPDAGLVPGTQVTAHWHPRHSFVLPRGGENETPSGDREPERIEAAT
ncbi:hypothetical protein Jiend_18880 [Micromonospora endophytica]|nr:hypothetical protein Jiend_18880 [Micromonospora endophytica]